MQSLTLTQKSSVSRRRPINFSIEFRAYLKIVLWIFLLWTGGVAPSSVFAQNHNIKDLGALLGTNSYAHGINNQGQVVGYWSSSNGARAFLYDHGVITDLGSLGGTNNYALSINSFGQVVGFAEDTNGIRAFLFSNGAITNLGSLGGQNSYAYGINDAGKVVGYLDTVNGARAFLYLNNSITNLGTLGGTNSFAFGINNSNSVVGSSLNEVEATHAFLWQNGVLTNLNELVVGPSGWVLNDARGINNVGKIVGWGRTNNQEQAFLFADGVIYGIGVLPGGTNSFAYGINNSNRVVGASATTNGTSQAFVWVNNSMTNLNTLLPQGSGWELREARGINDSGAIVGWGIINGQEHAFILTSNAPPSVALTSPTNNVLLLGPGTFSLNAFAHDGDGSVVKVEFYNGAAMLGQDFSEPFQYLLENVSEGSFLLTAVAIDDSGARSTSSVVNATIALPPVIALQPLSQRILTGSNVIFSVNTSGTIPLSYQWRFNGNNILGATDGSYSITNVQTIHMGYYSVQISNLVGSATSANAKLTVTVDPFNMGKGDWIYFLSMATNQLGGNVPSVVDVATLMNHERLQGMQFVVVKAGDGGAVWNQFNSQLVNAAHAAGLKIFGYARAYGVDIAGEIAVATNALALGADGFVIDAEIEYESHIHPNNNAAAAAYLQGIRAVYPNAFLAHAPFALISLHSTFPYVTFGKYCDVVMPQCYWKNFGFSAAGMVSHLNSEWHSWQNSLVGSDTNAIKPIAPIAQAWSPNSANIVTGAELAEFVNRIKTNSNPASIGGYKGVSFWRADLHSPDMWKGISGAVIGNPTGAPLILTQPQSFVVEAGDSAMFTVQATGSAPLGYQWRRNGNNISGATTTSHTRNNIQSIDVGVYSVVVSNAAGTVVSSDALLSMESHSLWFENFELGLNNWTTISSSLTNSSQQNHTPNGGTNSAKVGSSANRMYRNITTEIDGYSKVTFWIYDDSQTRAYGEVRAYSGAGYNQGSLQQIFAIGRYSASFGTGVGSLAGEVVDTTKYQGRVYAGNNTGWFNLNGVGVPNRSTGWHKFEIERLANGSAINFYVDGILGRTIAAASGARWDSVSIGSVAAGSTSGSAWFDDIDVQYFGIPTILVQPTNITANSGATVNFSVSATNNVTGYQWRKNGVNVSGATTSQLTLSNVNGSHGGEYTVVVANSVGSVISAVALLTVIEPPVFVTAPANQYADIGSEVTFRAVVSGTPPFSYVWKKNGTILADGGNISGSDSDELVISNLSEQDAAEFSVTVSNSAGSTTASAVLSVNRGLVFFEDFETGTLNNWSNVPGATSLLISGTRNNPVSGSKTAWQTNSLHKMYHNLGTEVQGSASVTIWIYDAGSEQERAIGEVRAYSGTGFGQGSLQQILAIGNYRTLFDANTGNLQNEQVQTNYYQGRVYSGQNTGWFNLNASGISERSVGWHKFHIERSADGSTIKFFVDGKLGRTITGAVNASLDTVSIGSYGAGVGDSELGWFDDIKIEYLAPGIISQPVSQTKVLGQSASFTVGGGGHNLSYQWQKDGINLPGANNATLTLLNVQPGDEGTYTVLLSNSQGTIASSPATLTVIVPPSITTQPMNQVVHVGSQATFTVQASGINLAYEWKKNGINLSNGGDTARVNTAILQINNVTSANEGIYTVVISNAAGSVSSAGATLSVVVPPTIATQPSNQSVVQGSPATFHVSANGTGPLQYQWRLGGVPIVGATASAYTRQVVLPSDAGSYSVTVSNPAGAVVSSEALLTVIVPPSIVVQPSSQKVADGANVLFSTSAQGTVPLAYQWQLNGQNVPGATGSSLPINPASYSDSGKYTVIITNSAGRIVSSPADLAVVGLTRITATGFDGSAQSICLGKTVTFQAVPNPENTTFPSGFPVWIVSTPSGVFTNVGMPVISMTNTFAGTYLVEVSCGAAYSSFSFQSVDLGDPDYNGIDGCQEILNGTNGIQIQLGSWEFDSHDWTGLQGQVPLYHTNVVSVGGWSILGALINSNRGPAFLVYPEKDSEASIANINCREGSIRFWFKPDWNSVTTNNGTGPQREGRLIELGSKGTTNGWWGLTFNSAGTSIQFGTQTNTLLSLQTNLVAPIVWTSNDWRQVVLTYSPTSSLLYVDGKLLGTGAGVSNWPGAAIRSQGFRVGTDANGTNWAQGRFDNLQTFNHGLSNHSITNYYKKHPRPLATNNCLLAPIALYVTNVLGLVVGDERYSTNGAGPGNFGWLNWDGNSGSAPLLALALTNWTKSYTYVNAADPTDTTLSVDDWVNGNSGVSSSSAVTAALSWLVNSGTNFGIVLWSESGVNSGINLRYKVAHYAQIRLLDFNLGDKWFKYKYLGAMGCDSISNHPPVVAISSPTNSQVFNLPGSIPIKALVHDPEDAISKVVFRANGTILGETSTSLGKANETNEVFQVTWPTVETSGTYELTAIATDALGLSSTSQVVNVIANMPPQVSAGSDRTVPGTLNGVNLTLAGYATDDGFPNPMSVSWSVISSNGFVVFENSGLTNSAITLAATGNYVLQLEASDGASTNRSQCRIIVQSSPTVEITAPTNNAILSSGRQVFLNAIANDLDGSVASVVFYAGSTFIGNGVVSTGGTNFALGWVNAPLGTSTLTAVAIDNDGLVATSSPVTFTLQQGPTISIITPADGSTFAAPARIRLTSIAEDIDGTITNVSYLVNGMEAGRSSSSPYPLLLTNVLGGTYTISAIATDHHGYTGTSLPIQFTVNPQPPVVSIMQPGNGEVFALSEPIVINTKASDPDGQINQVQLFAGTSLMATLFAPPYSWNWTNAPVGIHILKAVAKDNNNLSATSQVVTISVENCAPALLASFSLETNVVKGGGQVQGTIQLSGPAMSGGQTITLVNTNSAIITPTSVFVPDGLATVSFPIGTLSTIQTNFGSLTASYHGQNPISKGLTILPIGNGHSGVTCGPMDVAFLIDTTSSMSAMLESVKTGLSNTLDQIEIASGGDYRLALVSFDGDSDNCNNEDIWNEFVCVKQVFASTNRSSFSSQLMELKLGFGDGGPEPSDEALNTVINTLSMSGRLDPDNLQAQFGDFSTPFRSEARKIIILVTDALPGGFEDTYNEARGAIANQRALEAAAKGIQISAIYVNPGDDINRIIMRNYADTTGGVYIESPSGAETSQAIDAIVAQCGSSLGQVVFVRDDLNALYKPLELRGTEQTNSSEQSIFSTEAVSGHVSAMHMVRQGRLEHNSGSRFDLELGVSNSSSLDSYGSMFTNAQKLPFQSEYTLSWHLPVSFHSEMTSFLEGLYPLWLTDRASSICGNNYVVRDLPNEKWPDTVNTLSFVAVAERKVPSGRVRDFLFVGTNSPLNGEWDVVFAERVIASSGKPEGWDVEEDHSVFAGFNITVPALVQPASSYEVRVKYSGESQARSGFITVTETNTLNSVPVLMPIASTNHSIASGGAVSATIKLDAAAPLGGAYVRLKSNHPGVTNLPPYVHIPAGTRSGVFSFHAPTVITNSAVEILAAYNGYRKLKMPVLTSGGTTPGAPTGLSAQGLFRGVQLEWSPVSGALTYNIKRSLTNSEFEKIFTGLTSTNFVDQNLTPGKEYFYTVSAENLYGEGSDSDYVSASPIVSGRTPAPIAFPFGGRFNDSVQITLTNYLGTSDIFYTLDGTIPTSGSLAYSNSFQITESTTVRAFAHDDLFYPQDSRSISAHFTIVKPIAISCETNVQGSLTTTNAFSVTNGTGFFGQRYTFDGTMGKEIDISVSTTNFASMIYLFDANGKILGAVHDAAQTNSGSRLVTTLPASNVYTIEVTSAYPEVTGPFVLTLQCSDQAAISLSTNNVKLENDGKINFGTIPLGATVSSILTVSNVGSAPLLISEMMVAPSQFFSLNHSSLGSIAPGTSTNLELSFHGAFDGDITGVLILTNNASTNTFPSQNPFYVNLVGQVNALPGPPRVSLLFPTNGANIPEAPVHIQLSASASDADGIQNVKFQQGTTVLGTVTNAPYTMTWSNVVSGAYALTAIATDGAEFSSTSAPVNISVGSAHLTIAPDHSCVGLSNSTFVVSAALTNALGAAMGGETVTFNIVGAHPATVAVTTDSNGLAAFVYTGTNQGNDRISAAATVDSLLVTSEIITKAWARRIGCSITNEAEISTKDATIILGSQPLEPSRYADFYQLTGLSGDIVRLKMVSTNFQTLMFLLDSNCQPLATNEYINATDSQIRYVLPADGTYLVQATSFDLYKTGNYSIAASCGSAGSLPNMAVLSFGTNIQNFGSIDFGTTQVGGAVSRTITITNRGNAELDVSTVGLTEGFSISPNPLIQVPAGASAEFTVTFQALTNASYRGVLVLTNNDLNKNPFTLYLNAIANPAGQPPAIEITSPSTGSQLISPVALTIQAIATSTNATIERVDFIMTTSLGSYLIGQDSTKPYAALWNQAEPGNYTLHAIALDNEGRRTVSSPVTVEIKPSGLNKVPLAITDGPTVLANSLNNVLDVLANDSDPDGDVLVITAVSPNYGTASIINNGKALRYSPPPGVHGTDGLTYEISDGRGGVGSAYVRITIESGVPPQLSITNPVSDEIYNAGTIVPLRVHFSSPVENIRKVEYRLGQSLLGVATNAPFGLNWTAYHPNCDCTLVARATDKYGQVKESAPVSINITTPPSESPVAQFANLTPAVQEQGSFFFTNLATIQDGLFDLMGRAYDPDNTDVVWRLTAYALDGTLVRDLTPGPLTDTGYHIGSIGSSNSAQLLATCDFTTLQNGIYDLVLEVRGGYATSETTTRFRLESDLKIGHFGFSEQDLVIPVNGIPLTVIRSYNSLNSSKEDFGLGWTFAINDINLELDEERIDTLSAFDDPYSLRTGGGRNITLTLPNGRRATFSFYFEPVQCNGGDQGRFCLAPRWLAPPGVNATLTTMGQHYLEGLTGRWWNSYATAIDWYDFPGFILSFPDGTQYIIDREKQGTFTVRESQSGSDSTVTAYGPPYLSKIIQASGDVIEIGRDTFDSNGQKCFRIQHRNALGEPTRSIHFQRDAENRIVSISDPLGQDASGKPVGHPAVRYEYDLTGNLSKVLKLVDRSTGAYVTNQYLYENSAFPHYLTRMVDARGYSVARNLYDDSGRLIGIVDASGHTNRFEEDLENRRKIVYNRLNQPTIFHYDSRGNVLSAVDPLGNTNSFSYDTNGFRLTSTDPLGHVTRYTNDAKGNLTALVLPHPDGADPSRYTTHFTYREDGLRTSTVLATGAAITNIYDSKGNLTEVRDGDGNVISSVTYNSQGLPEIESDRFNTISFGYDGYGNLTSTTNSSLEVLESGYDSNGNMTNIVHLGTLTTAEYDGLNRQKRIDFGAGMSTSYAYDSDGDWSNVSASGLDPVSRNLDEKKQLSEWTVGNKIELAYGYNAEGQVAWVTNSAGLITYTGYDFAGRAIEKRNLNTGATQYFGYDANGRNIAVTNAFGHWIGYAFNPDGSIAFVTNETKQVWSYDYDMGGGCCGGNSKAVTTTDPLGRQMTELRSAYGKPVSIIWRSGNEVRSNYVEYLPGIQVSRQEGDDYPVAITDESGRTRRFQYTASGNIHRASDMSGANWWTNSYDSVSGALTNVASPTGETLNYGYDESGNLETIRFGDGHYLTNFYDEKYQVSSNSLPDGTTIVFAYDQDGNITNQTSSIGEWSTFQFNEQGALSVITDPTGSTTNLYDSAGQLWGVDYPSGASIRYELDLLGRVTAVTNKAAPSSEAYVTRYGYNAGGSITNIVDPLMGTTRFEYDRAGRRTKRVLPNNITTSWDYDWRDRITNIVHRSSGNEVLISFGYIRGPGGEPTRIDREDGSYVELQYDSSFRLTNEVYHVGTNARNIGYEYDASGNRVRLLNNGAVLTNAISLGYRITSVNDAANGLPQERYTYDNGGRIISVERNGKTLQLQYTSTDRLAAATNGNDWIIFENDANGRRTKSTDSAGVVRRFLVAGNPGTDLENPQIIADMEGSLNLGYVYFGTEPILRFNASGETVYYLEDGMGSIAALADDSGTTNATFAYDGFGNIREQNGMTDLPSGAGGDFRFHGTWLDGDTGLYHNRARLYDPHLGRFTTRDPRKGVIQRPETLNPYSFAVNNPCVFSDPTGEFTVVEINSSQLVNSSMTSLQHLAVKEIKNKITSTIYDAIAKLAVNQLEALYPPMVPIFDTIRNSGIAKGGDQFERELINSICGVTGMASLLETVYFFPGIEEKTGIATYDGVHCGGKKSFPEQGLRYPDFVVSEVSPSAARKSGKAILVGDIKFSGNSLYNKYVNKRSKSYDGPGQFDAMSRFARKYTYTRVVLFLTAFTGNKSKLMHVQMLLQRDGVKRGALVFIAAARENKGFNDH